MTDPVQQISDQLSQWRPRMLVAYSALAGILAGEQINGRLNIEPDVIMCVAETLSPAARRLIKAAWGKEPFENYAATETGVMAAECRAHSGLHLFEDLTITEVVDENNQPVPPGGLGAKMLVTVLFSRTLPLIRYEIDDRAIRLNETCDCGLAFQRLAKIGGRVAETLQIERSDGTIAVIHPIEFEDILGDAPVRSWQVVRRSEGLTVALVEPANMETTWTIQQQLRTLLDQKGLALLAVSIDVVDHIPRLPSGKMAVVRDVH